MKRLALLVACGSLWLFLAALPVVADGGPHVAGDNSGLESLTADTCAGCHRTHTAMGPNLLNQPSEEALCFSCHGTASVGATTNVADGLQFGLATAATTPAYALSPQTYAAGSVVQPTVANGHYYLTAAGGNSQGDEPAWPTNGGSVTDSGGVVWSDQGLLPGRDPGVIAGALRAGGFLQAAIDSAHSSRMPYPFIAGKNILVTFSSKVGVLADLAGLTPDPAPVTSAHLDLDGTGSGVAARGKAWGYGELNSGAGPTAQISCGSCHNPHGNGQYRILKPIPTLSGEDVEYTTGEQVTDADLPTGPTDAERTRNYTIQWGRTLADVVDGTYVDDGSPGTPDPLAGDYWRRWLPWDGAPPPDLLNGFPTGVEGDRPMYVPDGPGSPPNLEDFRSQITQWCLACHSRYWATQNPPTNSGDSVFMYRHQVIQTECTQCHVAHGSNASMVGYSGGMDYPDGSAPTSYTTGSGPSAVTTYFNSRLLKIDNRGTCQACHDPTGTIPNDGVVIEH